MTSEKAVRRASTTIGLLVLTTGWLAAVAGALPGLASASAPAPVSPGAVAPAPAGTTLKPSAPSGPITASGPGAAAVRFALAQVGKPYIYGAAGPYGYDCSGLALAAWQAAGTVLPRTAQAQYSSGTHVPLSELQPGDLVFWASDPAEPATIFHVAISLGGDLTVQATHSGAAVEVMVIWPQGLVPMATRP